MKCEQYRPMLDQFLEGELSQSAASEVSAHLTACQACDRHYQILRRAQTMYRQYLLDVEATPALWDGLRSEIEELTARPANGGSARRFDWVIFPFSAPRFNLALLALLALIGVGVGIAVVQNVNSREAMPQRDVAQRHNDLNAGRTSSVPRPEPSHAVNHQETGVRSGSESQGAGAGTNKKTGSRLMAGSSGPLMAGHSGLKTRTSERQSKMLIGLSNMSLAVRTTERQYLAAIRMLSTDFERRRSRFDPDELAQLRKALTQLDHSIAYTRRAVKEDPDDPLLVQYMMTAYAKKLDVLRQLTS